MSSNNNQRNNNNPHRPRQSNSIRGPMSALSSFLREQGIRVENRSRQEMQERRRQQMEREAAANANRTPTESAAGHDTTTTTISSSSTTESILYTPASSSSSNRRSRSAQAQAIIDAATSSSKKKKKRPMNDSSDEDDDDDYDGDSDDSNRDSSLPRPSTTSTYNTRSSRARIRVLFCSQCKGRFVRNNSDPSEETMCPDCVSGKDPKEQRKPTKKRLQARNGNNAVWFMHDVKNITNTVSSLQELCINVIADHIDDVEALGDISPSSMDKIAKIICRKRQLTNHTARLFMQPYIRDLCLYDCTNVGETGLKNIAHFCPNLKTLRLYYCGRMTDEVIELYCTHLKHLTSLTVSGCHLVTEQQWIRFFETVGDRLEGFSIRHTYRLKKDGFKALVENCKNLRHLCLSRIVTLSDDWLESLAESGINQLETLELSWPSEEMDRKWVLTTDYLNKILAQTGGTLKELILRGCADMTDDLLVAGILPHCHQLQKLTLEGCNQITSDAFQMLFSKDEWKLSPVSINRKLVTGLQSVSVARCLNFDDDALKALLQHSGNALTRLDIHSLDKLTVSALEAIAGPLQQQEQEQETTGNGIDDIIPNGYVTGGPHSGNDQHKRLKLNPSTTTTDTGDSTVCESLVYLDASFVRSMDDYVMAKLIHSCQNLKHVKVWGCHQVTDVVKVPRHLIVEGREFI